MSLTLKNGLACATSSRPLTRRQFLAWTGVATAGWAAACGRFESSAPAPSAGPAGTVPRNADLASRIARVIRAYDAQGIHRTGTAVDHEGARWLADEVRSAGLEASLEGVPFSKIEVEAAWLQSGDLRAEGLPLFDGSFTDEIGVVGRLGGLESDAPIGVARVPPFGASRNEFLRHRGESTHRALVAVTGGERWNLPAGMTPINADRYLTPYGPPVLQVASDHWPWLEKAAAQGAEARLVAQVKRHETEVQNVISTLPGTDPDLGPLVVMTPRSGWWKCASERGGGIAVWLETMRALRAIRASERRRSVHFVASTGHELGHVGLDYYLSTRREWIGRAVAWIHLGANFGAAVGSGVRLQASDHELLALALKAMSGHGVEPDVQTPIHERPLGEARDVYDGGGRYISLLGSNGLFHHPDDRWPDAVDLEKTVRFARAFSEIALELSRR